METLVHDLLDASRITQGLIELVHDPLDLRKVVCTALEQTTPLMDAKHHKVTVELGPAPLPVRGDSHRLTQVVANLLSNAAKFTPDHGRVEVRAWVRSEKIVVEVRDNGRGIYRHFLPHVFELFSQAQERSAERVNNGLGLGLALVKSLMELHGGSADVYSAGKDTGTCFTLTMPNAGMSSSSANLTDPLLDSSA